MIVSSEMLRQGLDTLAGNFSFPLSQFSARDIDTESISYLLKDTTRALSDALDLAPHIELSSSQRRHIMASLLALYRLLGEVSYVISYDSTFMHTTNLHPEIAARSSRNALRSLPFPFSITPNPIAEEPEEHEEPEEPEGNEDEPNR